MCQFMFYFLYSFEFLVGVFKNVLLARYLVVKKASEFLLTPPFVGPLISQWLKRETSRFDETIYKIFYQFILTFLHDAVEIRRTLKII